MNAPDRIKILLNRKKITKKQLAKMVGVRPETISRWLSSAVQNPKLENMQKLVEVIKRIDDAQDFDFHDLFGTGGGGMSRPVAGSVAREGLGEDYVLIPKVKPVLRSGHGCWVSDGNLLDIHAFRKSWIIPKGSIDAMVVMEVVGNSMCPTLCNGDHVLIDQSQTHPEHDRIMAIGMGEFILVKRVLVEPRFLRLMSDNPDQNRYGEIRLSRDDPEPRGVRFLGRVIWRSGEM